MPTRTGDVRSGPRRGLETRAQRSFAIHFGTKKTWVRALRVRESGLLLDRLRTNSSVIGNEIRLEMLKTKARWVESAAGRW